MTKKKNSIHKNINPFVIGIMLLITALIIYNILPTIINSQCPKNIIDECSLGWGLQSYAISVILTIAIAGFAIGLFIKGIIKYSKKS